MTLYFLGGGNMAAAIIAGLRRTQSPHPIHVVNRGAEKRAALAQQFQVSTSAKLPEISANDVLVLAVKPQDMAQACADVLTNGALVLSLAAGLSCDTISRYLNGTRRIIRIMPNTPARIGLGVSGLFADTGATAADRATAEQLMRACGQTLWLNQEDKMHAITAISGSGSAYVFYLMNALQQAALAQGFDKATAYQLSLHTFKGAVSLAELSGDEFFTLLQQVTSKGGTTFAALESFAQHHLLEHFIAGTHAAWERSHELAQQFSQAIEQEAS